MKVQIRQGVFETNSSNVHALTMCSADEFQKWKDGEVYFWGDQSKFATLDDLKDYYTDVDWTNDGHVHDLFFDNDIKTFSEYFDNGWFETYEQRYFTRFGEEIVAFGYYGHD